MRVDKYTMAQSWMRQDDATPEEAKATWDTLETEFEDKRKAQLMASAETDEIIKTINDKFGSGTMFPASEAPIPPMTDQQAIFEFGQRNPQADGGRIGFYKGSFVEGEGWVVKFASKTMKPKGVEMDDKWFGRQVFETEEAMNAAIEERKTISKKNTELKNKKLAERITREAEKGYKEIIDDFIEKGDYENFKSQVYESGKKHKLPSGKWRQTGGGRVPTHIVKFIRERLDAGPDTELFKDLKRITGRTEEELLDFSSKIPKKGSQPIKQRSKKAEESFPEDRKLTDEEKLEGERKQKEARKIKEAVGTKYASELELKNAAKIKTQISDLNTMFKNKPELINTPQYAKLKEMMEIQIAGKDKTLPSGKKVKAGELFRREVDSKGNLLTDDYYIKKAKEGKIMSFFDINKVGTQMGKYATNINITPSLFNSAFIQGQVETYFKKGGKFHGDTEKLKKVDDYLKSVGVKVKITDVGRIGGGDPVFYDSKTGNFPHITKTLNTMGFKDNALTQIKGGDFKNPQLNKFIAQNMMSSGPAGALELFKADPAVRRIANSQGYKTFMKAARMPGKFFGIGDAVFGYFDYKNNLSKGQSHNVALQNAKQAMSFGLWKVGDEEVQKEIRERFVKEGGNPDIFDQTIALNKKTQQFQNRLNEFAEQSEWAGDKAAKSTFEKMLTKDMNDILDMRKQFSTDYAVSEAGAPIQIKDTSQPFTDVKKAAYEYAKEQSGKPDVIEGAAVQRDATAGTMGNLLQNFLSWDFPNILRLKPTQKMREENQLKQLKEQDPVMFEKLLQSKGIYRSEGLNLPALINFSMQYPEYGVSFETEKKSNGGIAGVKKVDPDELKEAQEKMKKLMKQYKNKNLDWDAVKRSYKIWTK